jgi:NADH:ubiquinone oxidoreductase subunit 6 (subunit J)
MDINSILCIGLLAALLVAAISTAMTRSLLMSATSLAVMSICLAAILYMAGLVIAAVMELLVCTGLVTAVFASTIALLQASPDDAQAADNRKRLTRYVPLLGILTIVAGGVLLLATERELSFFSVNPSTIQIQNMLWDERALDIIGLALLILGGVLGVAALIRQREEK